MFDECELEVYQSRESWLDGRLTGIGSSDASTLLGLGYADSSEYALWAEKAKGYDRKFDKAKILSLDKGKLCERYLVELMALEHDTEVLLDPEHSMRRNRLQPYLTASLDGYLADGTIIECKAVSYWAAKEWDFKSGVAPLKFAVQAMHQMLVTGSRKAKIVCIFGLELHIIDVPFHEDLAGWMLHKYEKFWKHVSEQTEPLIEDGKKATMDAIRAVHPTPRPRAIKQIEGEAAAEFEEFAILSEEVARKQARLSLLSNRVAKAIGDHDGAVTQSGCRVDFKKHGKGRRLAPARQKATY